MAQSSHGADTSTYTQSPHKPGARSLAEIEADLHREIPTRFLSDKTKGGRTFTVFSWITAQRFLNYFAPGWHGRAALTYSNERVGCVYELCIPTSDAGLVCRGATGDDSEDDDPDDIPADPDQRKKWQQDQKGRNFGSPTTRAEGQAFKRAAARFGFGIYLRKG